MSKRLVVVDSYLGQDKHSFFQKDNLIFFFQTAPLSPPPTGKELEKQFENLLTYGEGEAKSLFSQSLNHSPFWQNILQFSLFWLNKNDHLFVATFKNRILLWRNNNWLKVLDQSGVKVGLVQINDHFLLSYPELEQTKTYHNLLKNPQTSSPKLVNEALKEELSENGFWSIVKIDNSEAQTSSLEAFYQPEISKNKKFLSLPKIVTPNWSIIKKIIGGIIILLILIKLVLNILGLIAQEKEKQYQAKLKQLKIEISKITKNFNADPEKNLTTLQTLNSQLKTLLQNYPQKKTEINTLANTLTKLKETYGNGEAKTAKLFFDPTLINKQVKITYFNLNNNLFLLDSDKKKVYVLNPKTKAYETIDLSKIKTPRFVAGDTQGVYIFDPKNGIYSVAAKKTKKVVVYDKKWGQITDFQTFNGNLYLLDKKNNAVYKYLPIGEDQFGAKLSYFQGGPVNLETVKNLNIDFSVYLLTDEALMKFTNGLRDGFRLEDKIDPKSLSLFYKNQENSKLFALDTNQARLLMISEKGKLLKTYINSILKKATSFGALSDSIVIFLANNKIYSLDNL